MIDELAAVSGITLGEPDVESTMLKLRKNDFQYASAGDVRRLMNALDAIKARNAELEIEISSKNATLENALKTLDEVLKVMGEH